MRLTHSSQVEKTKSFYVAACRFFCFCFYCRRQTKVWPRLANARHKGDVGNSCTSPTVGVTLSPVLMFHSTNCTSWKFKFTIRQTTCVTCSFHHSGDVEPIFSVSSKIRQHFLISAWLLMLIAQCDRHVAIDKIQTFVLYLSNHILWMHFFKNVFFFLPKWSFQQWNKQS